MDSNKLHILWIGAHPDDEAVVSGTLAKAAKKGHKVAICVISKSEKGSVTIPADELVHIREKEMKKAAEILGAEYIGNLGEGDHNVFVTIELIRKIVKMIRQIRPDIVITHWERDYHLDHINTGLAVTQAALSASAPGFKTGQESHYVQRLYYSDTSNCTDFEPDFWIDISDTIDIKIQSFQAHKTQLMYLGRRGQDPVERVELQSRLRGMQSNTKYAEAFRSCRKARFVHAELGNVKSLFHL